MNIVPGPGMNQTFGAGSGFNISNTLRLGDRSSSFDPRLSAERPKIDSEMAT